MASKTEKTNKDDDFVMRFANDHSHYELLREGIVHLRSIASTEESKAIIRKITDYYKPKEGVKETDSSNAVLKMVRIGSWLAYKGFKGPALVDYYNSIVKSTNSADVEKFVKHCESASGDTIKNEEITYMIRKLFDEDPKTKKKGLSDFCDKPEETLNNPKKLLLLASTIRGMLSGCSCFSKDDVDMGLRSYLLALIVIREETACMLCIKDSEKRKNGGKLSDTRVMAEYVLRLNTSEVICIINQLKAK